jgi:hypothetical protein
LVERKSSNTAAKSTIMMDTPAAVALVRERMAMIVVVVCACVYFNARGAVDRRLRFMMGILLIAGHSHELGLLHLGIAILNVWSHSDGVLNISK